MRKDLGGKTLGIIHAAVFTSQTVQKYIDEIIPEVSVMHLGDDTIQRDNLAAGVGVVPKSNYAKFITYARFLEEAGADLIMLACSTFNRAVEYARPMINAPMLQIDRPMMDLAVQDGNAVGLLATLPMTVPSSERLLRLAAEDAKKEIEIKTVLSGEAFKALREGDPEKHNAILLDEIDKLSKEVDAIVMAQVSMTALEPRLTKTRVPVYNSGRTGFTKAREILESL
ncbi:MAG TPA: aspartate/glutamate racemase family protein [Desulfatiglandales bacterium]|nr:aspartate/glutamate racemase family protein [Desulfatiglandales bacterium]